MGQGWARGRVRVRLGLELGLGLGPVLGPGLGFGFGPVRRAASFQYVVTEPVCTRLFGSNFFCEHVRPGGQKARLGEIGREMWARYTGDVGEMWARSMGDVWEM